MSSVAPLDATLLERLAELLDERAVPFKGFNLEALDGFLSALIVGPETVMPGEWQPLIWGGKPPRWIDEAEVRDVQILLLGFWNLIVRRVRSDPEALPDALAPVIWIPEDLDPERHADLDFGHDWGMGFLRGIELRKDAWRAWFDAEDWIVESLEWITQLVSGKVLGEEPDAPTTPLPFEKRLQIVAEIPAILSDLHYYRIEQATPRTPIRRAPTPGRNDPCPCGSGKKYKKCCG